MISTQSRRLNWSEPLSKKQEVCVWCFELPLLRNAQKRNKPTSGSKKKNRFQMKGLVIWEANGLPFYSRNPPRAVSAEVADTR
jgi:hypothetical protein